MFDIVKLIVSVKPMDMFQKYFVNAFFTSSRRQVPFLTTYFQSYLFLKWGKIFIPVEHSKHTVCPGSSDSFYTVTN